MMMMTIDEVCARQMETANGEMFLRLKGAFWMAYDGAAFAVARITGYEVKRQKTTGRYELGFSRPALSKVLGLMRDNGIAVDDYNEGDELIRFSGGDSEIDESMVVDKECGVKASNQDIQNLLDLRRDLMAINLADESLTFSLLAGMVRNLQIRCLSQMIM